MKGLYEALTEYSSTAYYPMHMPGHKRNTSLLHMENAYAIDITEIEGFDNLHEAEGIIMESMKNAADLYGSEQTYYLVNGSTVGLLAGMAACIRKGDRVLVARNCHKAVYNGVILNELNPVYLYPQKEPVFGINGGISAEDVKEMLITYPDIKLVIITSPTYEGIVSDIKAIAEAVHEKGIPLMVDEAHGAHLGFHSYFPKNAIKNGADLVIHSVHKTLPAFTQTALLHLNGSLVERDRVRKYLGIYQTTSPSYLLMGSIDRCMELVRKQGNELFEAYAEQLRRFYKKMEALVHLQVLHKEGMKTAAGRIFDLDPSKIVISTKNTDLSGPELYHILLEKYKIQLEMVSADYVLAMTSIADTEEGFRRLAEALTEMDQMAGSRGAEKQDSCHTVRLDMELSPWEAYNREGESVKLGQSCGRIAREYAYLYPPGIPLLVPGERISRECLELLEFYQEKTLEVKGLHSPGSIQVVKE